MIRTAQLKRFAIMMPDGATEYLHHSADITHVVLESRRRVSARTKEEARRVWTIVSSHTSLELADIAKRSCERMSTAMAIEEHVFCVVSVRNVGWPVPDRRRA